MKPEVEKVVQIIASIDTDTQKTVFLSLTSDGRIFKSHDLVTWKLVPEPNFSIKIVSKEELKLNG